jgi:ATP-NAD kinase N-terminal domain
LLSPGLAGRDRRGLGRDGTMLRAMRLADRQRAPVLGVSLGQLGFLAEVDVPDLPGAAHELRPDVALVDISLGAESGFGIGRQITPHVRNVILISSWDGERLRGAHHGQSCRRLPEQGRAIGERDPAAPHIAVGTR